MKANTQKLTVIASLTTRSNAVRMLHSRIQLIKSYLAALPPSYLTTTTTTTTPTASLSHPHLRSILALASRLRLLIPADTASFTAESLAEQSDVALVSLLGSLSRSLQEIRELGSKFAVVEGQKRVQEGRGRAGGGGGGGGGIAPYGSVGLPGMGMVMEGLRSGGLVPSDFGYPGVGEGMEEGDRMMM
jgi:COP9 signalosome complex subunit 6